MTQTYEPLVLNMLFLNKPTEPDYEPAPVINIQALDDLHGWIHIHRVKNHLTIGPKHNAMFASNWNKNDTVLTFRNKMEHLGIHKPYLGNYAFKLPDGSLNDGLHDDSNIETIIHSVPWDDARLYYVVLDYTE